MDFEASRSPGGRSGTSSTELPAALLGYERQYSEIVALDANAEEVFAFADDFTRLSSHMGQSSAMMMGSSMQTSFDEGRGQAVGSHVRMTGRMLGIDLLLDEVVREREAPLHKAWETVGTPRLLVIGGYRLGFDITSIGQRSVLRVFIGYNLPTQPAQRLLGRLFGPVYAKWCVRQMVNGAAASLAIRRFLKSSRGHRKKTLRAARSSLIATWFRNDYDDLIIAVGRFTDASRYRTDNISNARAQGVELSLAGRTRGGFSGRASYTFLDTEIRAVDGSPDAPSPFTVGDPLLRRPRHQGVLDMAWARGPVDVFAQGVFRGQTLDAEPNFGTFGGLFENPAYAVANLGATVRVSRRRWRSTAAS